MTKTILSTLAAVFTFTPAAFAGPFTSVSSVPTIYGQFGCLQRAQTKLFVIGATGITNNNSSVWGNLGESTVGIWCRGDEALIVVAGGDVASLRTEIRSAF